MEIFPKSWPFALFLVISIFSTTTFSQKSSLDAIFQPTPQDVVEEMLSMAGVNKEDIVYDLGCGDGRFVITAAAKFGAQGVGVDLDPARITESRGNAQKCGVADRVTFIEGNLFGTDLRDATVVTLFLLPSVNLKLRPKLLTDLKPGARIVSYIHDMKEWDPDDSGDVRNKAFYLWVVPATVAGTWRWSFSPPAGDEAQHELFLEQKFQKISGKMSIDGKKVSLTDPWLHGDHVSFTVNSQAAGKRIVMRFQGRAHGGLIQGEVLIEESPTASIQPWTAQRVTSH